MSILLSLCGNEFVSEHTVSGFAVRGRADGWFEVFGLPGYASPATASSLAEATEVIAYRLKRVALGAALELTPAGAGRFTAAGGRYRFEKQHGRAGLPRAWGAACWAVFEAASGAELLYPSLEVAREEIALKLDR